MSQTLPLPAGSHEPDFTENWTKGRTYWSDMFKGWGFVGEPDLHFLEIGCFEGRATLWLLENVLTHPSSRIDVIDTFEGSPEFAVWGIDGSSLGRFTHNVSPYAEKVTVRRGMSSPVLRQMEPVETYDFIYIDGSHEAPDVLADAMLAWPLLKRGGLLAFDDYKWTLPGSEHTRPSLAIDAFLSVYGHLVAPLHAGAQLAVAKL